MLGVEVLRESDDRLMTLTDLSEMLGIPVHTLYAWRQRGQGPAGYRIGRYVRYRRSTVEAWLEGRVDQDGLRHRRPERT